MYIVPDARYIQHKDLFTLECDCLRERKALHSCLCKVPGSKLAVGCSQVANTHGKIHFAVWPTSIQDFNTCCVLLSFTIIGIEATQLSPGTQETVQTQEAPVRLKDGAHLKHHEIDENMEDLDPSWNTVDRTIPGSRKFAAPTLYSTNRTTRKLEACEQEIFNSSSALREDFVKKRIIENASKGGNIPRNAKVFDELKPIETTAIPDIKRYIKKIH